jgi:hypothetical protein
VSEEMLEPMMRAVAQLRADLDDEEGAEFDMLIGLLNDGRGGLGDPPAALGLTDGAVRAFLAYMHEMVEIHDTVRMLMGEPRMPNPDLLGIAAAMLVGFKLGKGQS